MEDLDSPAVVLGRGYQTITISEDSGLDRDQNIFGFNHGGQRYVAAQQFPASFY
jgi:hypothetical protein